jgi:ABC-2 type transport system ATP-binding protein
VKRILSTSLAGAVLALAVSACGGGGTANSVPAANPPPSSGGDSAFRAGSPSLDAATSSPIATAKPTATPPATPKPTATPIRTPAPVPTPTPFAAPTAPPDASGHTNVVPALPAKGKCRAGQIYSIYVTAPTGDTVAMTVFEPATLCGGATYPLILHAPGFGGTRTQTLGSPAASNAGSLGNNLAIMVDNGYGVISFDQRGMGETTGKIRVMDPDFEGKDYLSVMNWAQAKLGWLAYGPTNEGDDKHEPIMGSIGGSYGGMYQFMLLNIDKRHRLRAINPNITPNNLSFSLYQGSTPKTLWNVALFGDGQAAGSGTSRGNFDPFVNETFVSDLAADQEDPFAADFFNYHSVDYFCNGTSIATNGGAGTTPELPPTTTPPKINALIWIGVRDTLFNFDNGYRNYECMKKGGGDVRLLSYQAGHNSPVEGTPEGIVPDPGVNLFYPSGDALDSRCGSKLNQDAAQLAWFNRYLKNETSATSIIPTEPCISLSEGDGVLVSKVTTGTEGTEFTLPSALTVLSGVPADVPTAQVLYTATSAGIVEAGIPHIRLQVTTTAPVGVGTPIIYVGIGQTHASSSEPFLWDLVDNQITPLRGVGTFDIDLIGGGTRLAKGDQLGLLVYGSQDQYAGTGSINVATPTVEPLSVTGKVWIPILGPVQSI